MSKTKVAGCYSVSLFVILIPGKVAPFAPIRVAPFTPLALAPFAPLQVAPFRRYNHSDQFNKCKRLIVKNTGSFPNDVELLKFYLFLSEYKLGNSRDSYKLLEELLENKPHIVNYRDFLKDITNDERVTRLLTSKYSEDEITEFYKVVKE